jgi:hypothetical protein
MQNLPEKKPESYISALSLAWEELAKLDPASVAENSVSKYDQDKAEFIVNYFENEYLIVPSKSRIFDSEGNVVDPFNSVLILHYLIYAKPIEPEGKFISFRELEGGDVYYDAFQRRSVIPLINSFGSNLEAFKEVGKRILAKEVQHGDVAFQIQVFPKIPVTVILWAGDDEVSPSANLLFDASIKELLPTEDAAVIGGIVASKLRKNKPDWWDEE